MSFYQTPLRVVNILVETDSFFIGVHFLNLSGQPVLASHDLIRIATSTS
jgi:hypothetical protein